MTSRLGACEVCAANNAIYTCPRCEIKTCSLNCSKIHKAEAACSGIRDRTKFISVNDFTNLDFLSDYRLLEEIGRSVETSKKPHIARKSRLPARLRQLQEQASKRHIILKFLPNIFNKHKNNSSVYISHTQTIQWTVELVFVNADNFKELVTVSETAKLAAVVEKYLTVEDSVIQEKLQYYQAVGFPGIKLLLKGEVKSKGRFYELDPTFTLNECLTNKTIIEYPVIHVILEHNLSCYNIMDSDDENEEPSQHSKTGCGVINKIIRKEETSHKLQNFLFLSDD